VSKSHKPHLLLKVGPPGSGKTHACLDEFEKALAERTQPIAESLLYILPTVEHRERITDLMLRRNIKGFFGRPITTFDETFQHFLRLGDIQFASDVTRFILLKELIESQTFRYFREAAHTRGFIDLISQTFAEFKETLLSPQIFQSLLPQLKKDFPHFEAKYDELSALYMAYDQKLIQANLKDRHDALFLLEEGLSQNRWSLPQYRHIWIDGFFEFSELQFAFIKFLIRQTKQLTVTLTLAHDERNDLFQVPLETCARLKDLGFEEVPQTLREQRTSVPALVHLNQHLFDEKPRPQAIETSGIEIMEATGLHGELEMIARQIKQAVREKQYFYSDIALIFRQVGPYLNAIRLVFEEYQIPVEIHEREELRLNPIARWLVNLFDIYLHDWRRDDLLCLIKSSFVQKNEWSPAEIELDALREGIYHGRENWTKRFQHPVFSKLVQMEDAFRKAESLEAFTQCVQQAFHLFEIDPLPETVDDQNRMNHAARKRLQLLLEEIKRKETFQEADFATWADLLTRLIEVDLFSFHHRDKNKVQVYNVSLARQKEYKLVFLPGLLEKQFPMQIKEDPILSDAERRCLNKGKQILKERLPRQAIERFLFLMGVTRSREHLVLTYPRFDLEGKEALPSFYIDEVQAVFDAPIRTHKQLMGDVLPPLSQIARRRELKAHIIQFFWQPNYRPWHHDETHCLGALYNTLLADQSFHQLLDTILMPVEGKITDERVKAFFQPKNDLFTPTRVEMYAECAYRYFADQILKLETDDEKIDPRVTGTILHDVLEYFHRWAKQKDSSELTPDGVKIELGILMEKAFQDHPLSGERWYRIQLKKKELMAIIERVIQFEFFDHQPPLPDLRPEFFEYEFGKNGLKDALAVTASHQTVYFRGKIDRIDVDASGRYALVIDYKSGKTFNRSALDNGTELQLPIYLMAVSQQLELLPLGAHLYQLSGAYSTGFHHRDHLAAAGIVTHKRNQFDRETWEKLFDRLRVLTVYLTSQIREAKIPVEPRDCVRFCPYGSVCRVDKWKLDRIYKEVKMQDQKLLEQAVQV